MAEITTKISLSNGTFIYPFISKQLDSTHWSNNINMPYSILWVGTYQEMGIAMNEHILYHFNNCYIDLFQNGIELRFTLYNNNDDVIYTEGVRASANYYYSIQFADVGDIVGAHLHEMYNNYVDTSIPIDIPHSDSPRTLMLKSNYIVPNSQYPIGSTSSYSFNYTNWLVSEISYPDRLKPYTDSYAYLGQNAETPDPYERAGTTEKRGGTGNLDDTSDPIDFPSLPTLNALNTGFVSLYAPTVSQVANLVNYMWSSDFVDSLVKMFTSPIESIIQFGMLPVNIPSALDSDVHLCNKSTGVAMNKAIHQFIEIDCGTLDVEEYWGSYLDYAPYTKIAIYCPFSDIHELECDDVMGQTLQLKYHIDILSGSFVAFLKCGDSVKYTWGGNMLVQLPITQSNWGQTYSAIAQFGASAVGTVATGGISALASASTLSSASNVMNSKPTVSRSGGIGGASAYMSVKTPYLIIKRPKQALAQNYSTYRGYPSNIEVSLADVSGYTEIESIHLDNIPCTQEEKTEIENLLNKGVIF